jgi:hypothetical protein
VDDEVWSTMMSEGWLKGHTLVHTINCTGATRRTDVKPENYPRIPSARTMTVAQLASRMKPRRNWVHHVSGLVHPKNETEREKLEQRWRDADSTYIQKEA